MKERLKVGNNNGQLGWYTQSGLGQNVHCMKNSSINKILVIDVRLLTKNHFLAKPSFYKPSNQGLIEQKIVVDSFYISFCNQATGSCTLYTYTLFIYLAFSCSVQDVLNRTNGRCQEVHFEKFRKKSLMNPPSRKINK